MKHRLLVVACSACFLALFSCGKAGDKDDAKESDPKGGEPATPVQVAPVTLGSIDRVVEADAILFPLRQSSVMPKISAPVKRFYVNRGDHVKEGQLIATLENRDLVAAEHESTANLAQAQSGLRTVSQATLPEDLTKAQSDVSATKQALDAAQKVYDSRVELLNQGAIARKLVEDAKVSLVQAQSAYNNAIRHLQTLQSVSRKEQVTSAQAQVDAARARTQSAEAQVSYSEIRSPISGIVADRPLFAGEMASPGSALLTIVEIAQVVARANINVSDAAEIRVGMPASIIFNGEETAGKVTVVSPAVDPNTTTVQVWVQANNVGERLKLGSSVRVSIKAGTLTNVVLVPSVALLNSDEGGQKVMVVDSKMVAHDRPVQVGIRQGERAQIVKGVTEGERVVTVGGLGLDDKAKVKIVTGKEEDKDEKKEDDDKEKGK